MVSLTRHLLEVLFWTVVMFVFFGMAGLLWYLYAA